MSNTITKDRKLIYLLISGILPLFLITLIFSSKESSQEAILSQVQEAIFLAEQKSIKEYRNQQVKKLYANADHFWIDKEIEIGRYIQNAQLPVPKVYERADIDGRIGIVYERIEGPSLLNELATKPWNVVRYGQLLAKLHVRVHEIQAPAELETHRMLDIAIRSQKQTEARSGKGTAGTA